MIPCTRARVSGGMPSTEHPCNWTITYQLVQTHRHAGSSVAVYQRRI